MSLSKRNTISQVETLDDGESKAAASATIGDLPPEIRTLLLEYLLDGNRKDMLRYRLVNPEWKLIIDSLLEKKFVSGQLEPFPNLLGRATIIKKEGERFYVKIPPTTCTGNLLPFNTVFIKGIVNCPPFQKYVKKAILLKEFMTQFGGNLTTFALDNENIHVDFNFLVSSLGFLHSLKCLSISNVRFTNTDKAWNAPPLPNLTVLKLEYDNSENKNGFPYLWLVASYADQLVRLNIKQSILDQLQPLRKQHQYYVTSNGKQMLVAATTSAAFGKLKELTVYQPSAEFLQSSETPVLEHFSVTSLNGRRRVRVNLLDFTSFIDRCSNTIKSLFMDINWHNWEEQDDIQRLPKVAVSKLKTLTLRYPIGGSHKSILYESFIPKFSGLEVLQFIWFGTGPDEDYEEHDPTCDELDLEHGSDEGKEHDDLKQQLASLQEREVGLQRELGAEKKGKCIQKPMGDSKTPSHSQRKKEPPSIKQEIATVRKEMSTVQKRLSVLNRKAKLIREFSEGGIWSSCPKLGIVSVSSLGKPNGDICILRRMSCGRP